MTGDTGRPGDHVAWYGYNATRPSRLHRLADDTHRVCCGRPIPAGRVFVGELVLPLADWDGLTCERCFPELVAPPDIPTPAVGQCWRRAATGRRGEYAGLLVWVHALGPRPDQVTLRVGVDRSTAELQLQVVAAELLDGRHYTYWFTPEPDGPPADLPQPTP